MAKAILLYSGGLDSILAAKVLMEQGIEVIGYHCVLPFIDPEMDLNELYPAKLARDANLEVVFDRCGQEYIDMVNNPAHGYGKQMNPCIDCKIFFINRATEYMKKTGADFVATGEVVGQRPMSQLKHTINHIRNETALEGRLLRPLSAKLLKPTVVEEEGLVDREKLLDISGRSRKAQFKLAEKYGIEEYSSPAGGCLFTDHYIAKRIKDLYEYHENYNTLDFFLSTIGRHFRINDKCKAIVPRRESETRTLERLRSKADIFVVPDFSGPSVYIRGDLQDDFLSIGEIFARYGKPTDELHSVEFFEGEKLIKTITISGKIGDDEFSLDKI